MKKLAYGTRLRYTDPDSSNLRPVHYVADITGPGVSVEAVEVTTHDSPDHFSEFLPGVAEGGDVAFDLMFDPDGANGHARILELIAQRDVINFQLLLPRPETQFLDEPEFAAQGDWGLSGEWTVTGGRAVVATVTPDGDVLSQLLGSVLLPGEIYRLAVRFAAVGTGTIIVTFDGDQIGVLIPAKGGEQIIEFNAGADAGELAFVVTVGPCSASIESITLTGITDAGSERFDFAGIFTKAGVLAPVKDALKASVSIKISGEPTFAPAV